MPTLSLKDSQMGDDTIYTEHLLTVRWSKSHGFWQFKNQKNSLLKINNYLLKRYSETIILYTISLLREIVVFIVFETLILKAGTFFLLYLIFRRGFNSWGDLFSLPLDFSIDFVSLLSSNTKNIYSYRGFPLGKTFLIG